MNRIQKLLLDEYKDFDDTVLIESTFAEISNDNVKNYNKGIRQVQLAITPLKFIVANDKMNCKIKLLKYNKNSYRLDPEIDTLELISILPLNLISIECIEYKLMKILQITYCTKQQRYFEFGGFFRKNVW